MGQGCAPCQLHPVALGLPFHPRRHPWHIPPPLHGSGGRGGHRQEDSGDRRLGIRVWEKGCIGPAELSYMDKARLHGI